MTIKNISFCTDFSENAEQAFGDALEMAKKYRAKLSIIHVLPPVVNPMLTDSNWVLPEEPRNAIVVKIEERMAQEYSARIDESIEHDLFVLDGHVSSAILKFLEDNPVDLVVMGSYGFEGMGLVVFGSVAKRVSHKAPCSVLIVRDRR